MNKLKILFLIGVCFLQCKGREPFRPAPGSVPYVVFFPSRYRGMCVGTVVSRLAVMTAAVCVTSIRSDVKDTRSLNVIIGAAYRHQRRGIRVQVAKILLPNLSRIDSANRAYLMSKSPAVLILKRKVPDALMEIPIRPIEIDWKGTVNMQIQEECLIPGWHFFYKGDEIYEPFKYLLQRNLRVQFMNIVKKDLWCDALTVGFEEALQSLGFQGYFDKSGIVCIRDPDQTAQPCHGMYGAPLVCRGKAVGMMMAPDAQWTNCTGFSNLIHLLSSTYLKDFMECISQIFEAPENTMSWNAMKKALYTDELHNGYDYVHDIYDKIVSSSSSESDL